MAAIASFLAESGCNITDSAQFDDPQTEKFLMRITFRSETGVDLAALQQGFESVAEDLGMEFAFHDAARRTKVLLMVSNFGHCLNDLLYRWKIGALPKRSRYLGIDQSKEPSNTVRRALSQIQPQRLDKHQMC